MKIAEFLSLARRAESTLAPQILGAEIRLSDSGDYPMQPSPGTIHAMVVWESKHRAMESMEAQTHLWEYGAEPGAFERVYPQVTGELS